MKLHYFLLLCCSIYGTATAQEYKSASKESEEYHEYRTWLAEPPYGLTKVKDLIDKIKSVDAHNGVDDHIEKPDPAAYDALTLREKFTYHMIHGESSSQICDADPPIQDEHKKIFGQLPDLFFENNWGDRQHRFFVANRDSVIQWVKVCVAKDKRIGINYKQVLVDINAVELIPFLISTYNSTKKDHDILTVLMLMMRNNEYEPFMASASNKKLYNSEDYSTREAFLIFNTANEELIIKRATDFYNGFKK